MHSHRASALFFYLTNALLIFEGALSLEAQAKTSGANEADHRRTLGKTANDDEILKNILPLVVFDCLGKTGYFADKKFDCEVFHYCDPDGSRSTFHCPNNFFFNSELMVCEEMTENKKRLCFKDEDADQSGKKMLGKNHRSDSKLKIGETPKKKFTEKSTTKAKLPEDLDQVSSDLSVAFSENVPQVDGMMALEDVLSYMNSDSDSNQPKTFVSTFLKTSGDRSAKALVNTSIINPFKKLKGHALNPQAIEIQKTSSKERTEEVDFPSSETTAAHETSLRKRKRGRRGRTLSSEESWSGANGERHRSHVSARSPADHDDYVEEKENYGKWDDKLPSTRPSPGSLRLFDIESRRNTTDSWRKRRRQYRRRRKHKNLGSSTAEYESSLSNTTDGYDQTTNGFLESHRTKSKKSNTSGWERSAFSADAMKPQVSSSIKVSYLKDVNEPTGHDSQSSGSNISHNSGEISANIKTEIKASAGAHQNPWFKSTAANEDDDTNIRFGERTTTSGTGFAREPYYGDENGSVVMNHFFSFDEKPDRSSFNQNIKTSTEENVTQKPKFKYGGDKKADLPRRGSTKPAERRPVEEERKATSWNQDDTKERQKKVTESQFSPSPDKIRRPAPPKKQDHEWSSQWSPIVSEVTTLLPPLPLKASFADNHDPSIAAVMEEDGIRWKQRATSAPRNKPRVPVGSSYKHWKDEPKVPLHNSPQFNTTSTPAAVRKQIKNPVPRHRNIYRDRKKEWPKQTLAHQHLSKVMNDFLAIPPANLGLPKVNHMAPTMPFETFVPKYRIPNEDIYVSESIPKEIVKNHPPDIFEEIVDLISKHSIEKPKETAMQINSGSDAHRVTIKDALVSVKSLNENREKPPPTDIDIVELRETLEELFGEGMDKIIGRDHSKEYEHDRESSRVIQGSIKKITELSQEEQEELKEIAEIAKFTSLRLKPLLTSVLRQASKELNSDVGKTTAETTPLRSTIITAKKMPLRVLYGDDDITSKEFTPKLVTKRPSSKTRSRTQASHYKMRRKPPPVPSLTMPIMVLHPPSLRPPHPPPLQPRYPYPMMHMPYGGIRPMFYHPHYPYIPRRRKRSPQFLRRIGAQRWNYSPFPYGVLSPLASNHGSTLFRRPFILHRFPTPSLPNPFRFPYSLSGSAGIIRSRKPRLRKPAFLPRQPIRNIPQPVRHIPQPIRHIPQNVHNIPQVIRNIPQPVHSIPHSTHQTVIIEEVPIPIPVEVPHLSPPRVPSLSSARVPETLRPPRRPTHFQDTRVTSTAFRKPAQLHQAPFPFGIGVIGTSPKTRPVSTTYSQPENPNQGAVRPTGVREPKFQFTTPVAPNSIVPSSVGASANSNRNVPRRPMKPKPQVILTQTQFQKRPQFTFPFDTKDLHVNSYPNFSFPFFQSGPPSSFSGILSPNKEKKLKNPDGSSSSTKESPKPPSEVRTRPVSSRPGKVFDTKYRETGSRFSTPSSASTTSVPGGLFVVSPPDSSTFPQHFTQNSQTTQNESPLSFNWSEESKESSENGISNQRPNSPTGPSSRERKQRRRRPGARRRRPRPGITQAIGSNSTLRNASQSDIKTPTSIWKVASPPQQIPPPPSEIPTQTLKFSIGKEDERSAMKNVPFTVPSISNVNISDEKNTFPPAGYYGSEQLSKILETSFSSLLQGFNDATSDFSTEAKPPSLSTTEQPGEESNLFSGEETAFYSEHDGVKVPFGTRLKTKPRSRANLRQNTREQNVSPGTPRNVQSAPTRQNPYRGSSFHEPGSQSTEIRDTVRHPSRRKPDRPRYPIPGNRLNKDVRGIRPEVIYYDTRAHPDGLFKIESDVRNNKPPTPVLMRTHAGTREIFHLPNPYADRDLFGINPPSTPRPIIGSNGFYGAAPLRAPPREKPDFVIPRRPHTEHSPVGSPSVSNLPPRPSVFRQSENPQVQYRIRERKRPTPQPKPKSEVRTSTLILETTTPRPYSPSTQVIHKTKDAQKTPDFPYYPHKPETSASPKDVVTQRWTIRTTTAPPVTASHSARDENIVTTTTAENLETKTPAEKSSGFIPVRGIPKTIHGAKLDLNKINASISTSVSVSSSSGGNHVSSAEASVEGQPKKVFSSKNGGLAVVRKRPRQRKKNRNRVRTTAIPKIESSSSLENGLNDDEKLQIAASIQDIIKATSESECALETQSPPTSELGNSTMMSSSSKTSKKWILPPPEDVPQSKTVT